MKKHEIQQEAEALAQRFKGVSQAAFAREHGVKGGASMVSQHIKGRRPINMDHALAYARGFNVPLEEISKRLALQVRGAFQLPAASPERGHPPGTPESDPKAQMLSHLTPMIDPRTIAWELILSTLLPPLFRAVIPDDAMSPDYPKGLEFIWSTTKTPQVASLVMVRDAHDQAHVREYRQGDGPGQWEAAALNRAFKSFKSQDGLTILAVAAFRSMP